LRECNDLTCARVVRWLCEERVKKEWAMVDFGSIIEAVVRERLTGSKVLDVKVIEDIDVDGDPMYRVMVIVETGKLDVRKTTGLARYTRARLSKEGNRGFPIFRFVSKSDAKGLIAAAA
jgi:hypothetical protein